VEDLDLLADHEVGGFDPRTRFLVTTDPLRDQAFAMRRSSVQSGSTSAPIRRPEFSTLG
jgi:hypothetical protein